MGGSSLIGQMATRPDRQAQEREVGARKSGQAWLRLQNKKQVKEAWESIAEALKVRDTEEPALIVAVGASGPRSGGSAHAADGRHGRCGGCMGERLEPRDARPTARDR